MTNERGWMAWLVTSALVAACATGTELESEEGPGVLDELDGAVADARTRDAATPPKRDVTADAAPDTGTDEEEDEDAGTADASSPIDAAPDTSTPPPPPLLYAHSADALYRYDGVALTRIGSITGVAPAPADSTAIDLAVDRNGQGYLTTFSGFYRIDLGTGVATLVRSGAYPNSLSFVPAGALDPNQEVLVAYDGATYLRINTTTGITTTLGSLGGGYVSSGDIVSVAGGGTFVTVTPTGCTDCVDNLVRINPQTGAMQLDYGSVGRENVYGLAYWAGVFYGFAGDGVAFTIRWNAAQQMTTANLALAGSPAIWNGAASSTLAPATAADGSGPPL